MTFSLDKPEADVYASDIQLDMDACAGFVLNIAGDRHTDRPAEQLPVQLRIPGRHNVNNALAAAACALAVGMTGTVIAAGLESVSAVAGRMEYKAGLKGSRVIDDSYNANPGSVKAAIDVLADLEGRRVLVLGDMAELGSEAGNLHYEVGAYARDEGIDLLLATGDLSARTIDGFGKAGQLCDDQNSLLEAVFPELAPGVTVLVKGSRSAAMDKLVEQIITTEGCA